MQDYKGELNLSTVLLRSAIKFLYFCRRFYTIRASIEVLYIFFLENELEEIDKIRTSYFLRVE